MRLRPRGVTGWVVAGLTLTLVVSGTAAAATGGTFTLGQKNTAGKPTVLTNTGNGPALTLKTKNKKAAPLKVTSSTKVKRLNADLLDGVSVEALQRRVAAACGPNQAIRSIGADGRVACVALPTTETFHAVVDSDGTLVRGTATSAERTDWTGEYVVRFPRDVRDCTYTATVGLPGASDIPPPGLATVVGSGASRDGVYVATWATNGASANRPFMLTVTC